MAPSIAAPPCDGRGDSFAGYAMEVEPWGKATNLGGFTFAAASVLQIDPITRDVYMAAGSGRLLGPDRAHVIPKVLRGYFAPDALDATFQDVGRLSHFQRTT